MQKDLVIRAKGLDLVAKENTLKINRDVKGVTTVSMQIIDIEGVLGGSNFKEYEKIGVLENGVTYYVCFVKKSKMQKRKGVTKYDIKAVGPDILAGTVIMNKRYEGTYSVGDIVQDIADNYIYSVSGTSVSNFNTNVDLMELEFITVKEALNKLSERVNAYWYIDRDYVLNFKNIGGEMSSVTLTDNKILNGDLTLTSENKNYANTIVFSDAWNLESGKMFETAGDGNTRSWDLEYAVWNKPNVYVWRDVNSTSTDWVQMNVGRKDEEDPDNTYDFYYGKGDNNIVQNSNKDVLLEPDRLRVEYEGMVRFDGRVVSTTEEDKLRARTSGYIERVYYECSEFLVGEDMINSVGQDLLNSLALDTETLEFFTDVEGIELGQTLEVNLTKENPSYSMYAVESVEEVYRNGYMYYNVRATAGTIQGSWTSNLQRTTSGVSRTTSAVGKRGNVERVSNSSTPYNPSDFGGGESGGTEEINSKGLSYVDIRTTALSDGEKKHGRAFVIDTRS